MNIGLIVVGDEILSGKRTDKHLAKVIELLSARDLGLSWMRLVGDDPTRIAADLRDAFRDARVDGDCVFCCGGIGATPDDHTRQAAAAALGRPLLLHPEARDLVVERMRDTARERGVAFEPDRADNVHRLNMAVFPQGAQIIPNPYNKIAGFSILEGEGGVHFVPGFPVMAWPMIEWVLDTRYPKRIAAGNGEVRARERSVIVYGAMEAALTPLMESVESRWPGVRVFSLPSVDHPELGAHIELGVKVAPGADASAVASAYAALIAGLREHGATLGSEMVR